MRARFNGFYDGAMDTHRKIRAAIAEGGIQKKELAEVAGVNRKALDYLDTDDWNPTLKTLLKLGEAVDTIMARRIAAVSEHTAEQAA